MATGGSLPPSLPGSGSSSIGHSAAGHEGSTAGNSVQPSVDPQGSIDESSRLAEASSLAGLAGKGTILRFTIEPDGFIDPVEFPLDLSVRRLRDAIAADLNGIPPTHLVIRFKGIFAHPD